MSSIGNSGARSSGPTGWSVPGCSGGGGGAGRSGITLYHWRGISDSSSVILVRAVTTASDLRWEQLSEPYLPARQRTSVLTAAVSSANAILASAKYMLVLGSAYSSLSMPA